MRSLLVAAAGGHLQQLHELVPRFGDLGEVEWVTFDTAQSRTLLAGQPVHFAEYPRPRDVPTTLRHARLAVEIVRRFRPDVAISTGSSIAVAFLPVARYFGAVCHYIESATRLDGPSLTGRVVRRVPGIHLYTQHPGWADRRWQFRGSVFDGFRTVERTDHAIARIVVSVGSSKSFGFRRLVESVRAVLPAGSDVLWQTGDTDVSGLGIEATPYVPGDELARAISAADLVVCHAGVGSVLTALSAGRLPVVVPRDPSAREHVDDHQWEIARFLERRGLAVVPGVGGLDIDLLQRAAGRCVIRTNPPPFRLSP